MPSQQDIDNQRQRLETYRENVQVLLRQIAHYSGPNSAPVEKLNSLREARAEIARCKVALRGWGENVEGHPDDSEPSHALTSATLPGGVQTVVTARGTLKLGLYNELHTLDELHDGSLPCIGETYLIRYTGPSKPSDSESCLALEHAYRSEVALRYAEWRRRYVPLPL